MIKRGKDPRSPVSAFRARRGRAAKSQQSSKKESTFDASDGFKSISRSHESGFFSSQPPHCTLHRLHLYFAHIYLAMSTEITSSSDRSNSQ